MRLKRRNLLAERILTIVITAVITFSATVGGYYVWDYYTPDYSITFDKNTVDLKNIRKFNQVRDLLKKEFYLDVDENVLLEGAIAGMASSLKDPYTRYLTVEQQQKNMESLEGSYVGIGCVVTLDENNVATVVETYEGSPAREAGLLPADKIVKVDDRDVTALGDLDQISELLRGEINTKVTVTVYRASENRLLVFEIVRRKVTGLNIKSEILEDRIGYVLIEKFDFEVAPAFFHQMTNLMMNGIKGLILDLRDNPGGSFDQVVRIADIILPEGMIVYTEDKYKRRETHYSDASCIDLPIVVLVNGRSASASEILAGAIKDNNWGTLVGTRTFGKGLVQGMKTLEDGSGLNITIARYFTPSGVCIHEKGIEPDVEIEVREEYKGFPVANIPREDDIQLQTAVKILKEKMKQQ